MGSLSPCLTSSASSTPGKEGYSKGGIAVEKIRQIHFNNKVTEQLQTLRDLQHSTTLPQNEMYVNTASHDGWKRNLTPTPSPTPTLASPNSEDEVGASVRLGQALKEIGYRICRAGIDRLGDGKIYKASSRKQHDRITRSGVNRKTQFFQLNSHNQRESVKPLPTTFTTLRGSRSRTYNARNATKYRPGRSRPSPR